MFLSSAKTSTAPGWEEALRGLVAADTEFIMSKLPEEADAALLKVQNCLFQLQGILGYVAHSLLVPEDIGEQMMSLTEGWENFWLDYDMLSAVHSAGVIGAGQNILELESKDPIDVMDPQMNISEIVSNRSLILARRRLIKSMNHDFARNVYVCARITSVDILLRQPKKSAVFLNSYFQTFPSFICQTASIANLMVNRALSSAAVSERSIEPMIAFAAMSLLATIVCETNHVTQALSVLSANNPHSGLLANLLSLTLSPMNSLPLGAATANMSKGAVYLLLCSIQNAKHPSSISSPPILRKILETLVHPSSHPDVIHACCICLEVSLEFCPSAFAVLFRDLDALDKLVRCGLRVVKKVGPAYERSVSSIFSLLRFSFQTQEIHVGINLHEKLTGPNSEILSLFLTAITDKSVGKGPFNGCMTLVGNVIADDPLIISTMAEVGLVDAVVTASRGLEENEPKENITACFVAMCALCLHESGTKKLAQFGTPMTDLLRKIAGGQFRHAAKLPQEEYWMEENRMIEDIGMVIGQSCDDVLRNRVELKDSLIEAVIAGMLDLLEQDDCSIDQSILPGLRILYGGFLSTSACVGTFVAKGGMEMLNKILEHPKLVEGSLLKPMTPSGRGHPIVAVFRQIGAQPKPRMIMKTFSQFATACLLMNSAFQGIHSQHMISGQFVNFMAEFWDTLGSMISKSSEDDWALLGWTAVKTFVSTVARLSNSTTAGMRGISPGCIALASLQAHALKRMMHEPSSELVDVLSRCFVDDKTHSLRPVSVLLFYRVGGMALLADWLRKSEDSYLEPLLILVERLTSVKRITNSGIAKDLQRMPELHFHPETLSASITCILGRTCFSQHLNLVSKSLSPTSATAVIKIYSHTVMLSEWKDFKHIGSPHKQVDSPQRKKPRKQLEHSTDISMGTLHTHFGESLSGEPWVKGAEIQAVGKQVALEFLNACIELGDKGGCEAAVAELVARHADYLGVDITNKEGGTRRKSSRLVAKVIAKKTRK